MGDIQLHDRDGSCGAPSRTLRGSFSAPNAELDAPRREQCLSHLPWLGVVKENPSRDTTDERHKSMIFDLLFPLFAHTLKPPPLRCTRTNTSPYSTEASSAGRSWRACVARAVSVERGGMGERGCARRLGEWLWV